PNGYATTEVECPNPRPSVRSAATLSPSELNWPKLRRQKTLEAMKDFFGDVHVKNIDAVSYLERVASPPNVDIAVSGGGYRALMNGSGALKAFDKRTVNATATG
ncbi:uncharacterized protein BO95DRAFT_497874, partial [Aspergillus brunneoviolaceus CBS 621.78]